MAETSRDVKINIVTTANPKPVQDVKSAYDELWETLREGQVKSLTEEMGLTPEEAESARQVLDSVKDGLEQVLKGGPESVAKFTQELEAKLAPEMAKLEKKILEQREQEYQAHRRKMEAWKREELAQDAALEAQARKERQIAEEREFQERMQRNAQAVEMQKALAEAEQMRMEQNIVRNTRDYDPAREAQQWKERTAGATAFGAASRKAGGDLSSLNNMAMQAAYLADDMQYGWRGAANNLMMFAASVPVVGGALALALPVVGVFIQKLGQADEARLERLRTEIALTKEAIKGLGADSERVFGEQLEQALEQGKQKLAAYQEAIRAGAAEKQKIDAQSQAQLDLELAKLELDKQSFIAAMGEGADRKAIDAQYKQIADDLKARAAADSAAREIKAQVDNMERAVNGMTAAREQINAVRGAQQTQRAAEDDVRGRMAQAGILSDQDRIVKAYQDLQARANLPNRKPAESAKDAEELAAMSTRYGLARKAVREGRFTYEEAAKGEGVSDNQLQLFTQLKSELDNLQKSAQTNDELLKAAQAALSEATAAKESAQVALELAQTKAQTLEVRTETERLTRPSLGPLANSQPDTSQAADTQAAEQESLNAQVNDVADQLRNSIGQASGDVKVMLQGLLARLTDGQGDTAAELAAIQAMYEQANADKGQAIAGLARTVELFQQMSQATAGAIASLADAVRAANDTIRAVEARVTNLKDDLRSR